MKGFFSLLFIPQERNNHRALLLHPSFLGVIIALYLLNQSLIKSLSMLKPGILGYSSEITVQKVLDQTNLQRQKLGLPPLKYNALLSESAVLKAEDMFQNNYWAHNSPAGKSPWDFFQQAGYHYTVAGENLARDFYDTESMLKAWMNSPTHRDNIINSKYQEIGIGVVNGVLNGVKTTLVVQHFATPTPQQSKIAETSPAPLQTQSQTLSSVLQVSAPSSSPKINPLLLSKILGTVIFGIIVVVLVIDSYITLKQGTSRFTGSSAGHIGFLMVILMLLIFTQQGSIF